MRTLIWALVTVAGLATVQTANAAKAVTIGPFSDVKADNPILPQARPTVGYHTAYFNNVTHQYVYDFVQQRCIPCEQANSPFRVIQGVGYTTSPNGNFTKGSMQLTTIYGMDLDPNGTQLMITGYTPGSPEVTFDSETFIGKSRTIYNGTMEAISIADLPGRLGSGFDLSPFQSGDPNSVVFLSQTSMPAKDAGAPSKGNILTEDFSGAFHVGPEDPGGSFDVGELPGTNLVVTGGNVDVLGVVNGSNGSCLSNPAGNCLDLIGDVGNGAVQSLTSYNLSPAFTYTIEFSTDTGDLGGSTTLDFTASLGSFSSPVTATPKSQKIDLSYTPKSNESAALGFASITNVDGVHGPVLSNIIICAHKAGSKHLKCS